ncbi:MAG: hypothetical protein SFV54_16655 [Bryobacteraceae bacterium]|nr:hypothetical protein [Bryobacteraceae bacterium]
MTLKTFLAALLLIQLTSAQDAPSIDGRWRVHSSISGNESDIDCSFSLKDDAFSGPCTSPRGELQITGKLSGKKLTFQFKTMHDGGELTLVYSGEWSSHEKFAGSVEVQPLGVSGAFTAARLESPRKE